MVTVAWLAGTQSHGTLMPLSHGISSVLVQYAYGLSHLRYRVGARG
jgi:hypothetical protein